MVVLYHTGQGTCGVGDWDSPKVRALVELLLDRSVSTGGMGPRVSLSLLTIEDEQSQFKGKQGVLLLCLVPCGSSYS